MLNIKRKLLVNLKNIPGWSTRRRIVVFSADDYGNVRIASKKARENLKAAGLNIDGNRFDQYDSLENKDDLSQLYDTLVSVKDKNGNNAIFTAFALSANIDFEAVRNSGYSQFYNELLPVTFSKLPGYEGTWNLWQEGIKKNLLFPQFHGREHLNQAFFNRLLSEKNEELIQCINNDSFGGFTYNPFKQISYTGAFTFDKFEDVESHKRIIEDGLDSFERVFGFRAAHFTAPGAREHRSLEKTLFKGGIKYLDVNLVENEHQGDGIFKKKYFHLGMENNYRQCYILRNCVFEPLLNKNRDEVDSCLSEIEIAFKWNKPANISTHRVNFSGHIDSGVRDFGLRELRRLIKAIVKRWPNVEFMTTNQLGDLINQSKSR